MKNVKQNQKEENLNVKNTNEPNIEQKALSLISNLLDKALVRGAFERVDVLNYNQALGVLDELIVPKKEG